ncbi:MAG: hypothetical protein ONB15_05035 [candidate division KSB1 bacterium]|nr:hypothetical protein [candidate division KSB1 bacterium]
MAHQSDNETDHIQGCQVDFPLADTISLRTLVNLLLKKGVVTVQELLDEESRNLAWDDEAPPAAGRESRSQRMRGLKRLMSKRRFTRRLGTWLFGWHWKRVRVETER